MSASEQGCELGRREQRAELLLRAPSMRVLHFRNALCPAGVRYRSCRRRSTDERLRMTNPRSSSRSVSAIIVARSMPSAAATSACDTPALAWISHSVGGLLLRQLETGHRRHEIAMHRALCAAQQIAQQAIQLGEHQFGAAQSSTGGSRRFTFDSSWHLGLSRMNECREFTALANVARNANSMYYIQHS